MCGRNLASLWYTIEFCYHVTECSFIRIMQVVQNEAEKCLHDQLPQADGIMRDSYSILQNIRPIRYLENYKIYINVIKKVKAQIFNPYKPLCAQINFKLPIFAVIILNHFYIIITICYGRKEAAEITVGNIAKLCLFGSQNCFNQQESWDLPCC